MASHVVWLGATLAECQQQCLQLAPAQQAPCLNSCLAAAQPLVSEKTAKAVVTSTAALLIAAAAGILGLVVGANIGNYLCDQDEDGDRQ